MKLLRYSIQLGVLAALPAQAAILTPSDCNGLRPSTTLCNLDPATGLHWLDWDAPEAIGRSYDDISGRFGALEEFDGFRYATEAEVEALLSLYTSLDTIDPPDEAVGGDVGLVMLMQDLGVTFASTDFETSIAVLADEFSPGNQVAANFAECQTTTSAVCDAVGHVLTQAGFFGQGQTNPAFGHALVAQGAAVPEPSSIALLALGIGCLVCRRIRRDRRALGAGRQA